MGAIDDFLDRWEKDDWFKELYHDDPEAAADICNIRNPRERKKLLQMHKLSDKALEDRISKMGGIRTGGIGRH